MPGVFGDIGNIAGIYRGVNSGSPQGDISAAANAAQLGASNNLFGGASGEINTGATGALDALGVIGGLERGGWQGDTQAAGSALQGLGLLADNPAMATAGGYILAPLSIYNAIHNWQSGATGSDALLGAEAGASIGSIIPGLGTLIGGALGAGVGALSSAFGDGRTDPETKNWDSFISATGGANANPQQVAADLQGSNPEQLFNLLTGVMDYHGDNGRAPIESAFGRMGETNVLNGMTGAINQAIEKNPSLAHDSASQLFSQVATPYLNSKGATISPTTGGVQLQDVLTNLIGDWQNGSLTSSTPLDSGGDKDRTLQAYAGQTPSALGSVNAPMRVAHQAEGGHMNKRKSALDEIYQGPHFSDRQNFDDGGSAYSSYSNYDSIPSPSWGGSNPDLSYTSPGSGGSSTSGGSQGIIEYGNGNAYDPNTGISLENGKYYDENGNPISSSQASHSILGDLSNAWNNLSGQNGISAMLKGLAGVGGLASLFIHPKTNLNPPSAAPGMTQGATTPKAPMFTRTQNSSPSNTGAPMTQQDWYTYGSRPEASFFNNNQVPLAQMTGVAHAKGGRSSPLDSAGMGAGPEFDSAMESHVNGPGDGTSDSIPAQLSDGEYVMDANTVSMLGNGSNKAGAARLDALRENLRKHAAKPMSKGKQFMKAKPPEHYMGGKAGSK